jgi:hypothetical protein
MIETTTPERVIANAQRPTAAALAPKQIPDTRQSCLGMVRIRKSQFSLLPIRSHQARTVATPLTAASGLISSRNLDLCLLFVCSCLLSLLCHQMSSLHSSAIATRSQLPVSSSPTATLAQLDFLIKAGLKTSSHDQNVTDLVTADDL